MTIESSLRTRVDSLTHEVNDLTTRLLDAQQEVSDILIFFSLTVKQEREIANVSESKSTRAFPGAHIGGMGPVLVAVHCNSLHEAQSCFNKLNSNNIQSIDCKRK